eukprot:1485065-Rhodomonas_salina.1
MMLQSSALNASRHAHVPFTYPPPKSSSLSTRRAADFAVTFEDFTGASDPTQQTEEVRRVHCEIKSQYSHPWCKVYWKC